MVKNEVRIVLLHDVRVSLLAVVVVGVPVKEVDRVLRTNDRDFTHKVYD